MKRKLLFVLLALCCVGWTTASGQPWAGIINPSRATDWSHVGATINNRTTACVTSACNTVSSGTVTTTSVNAAIASAPANSVINIPAGTFTITGGIQDTGVSNITLRGAGPLATILYFVSGNATCSGLTADMCFVDSLGYYNGNPAVMPGGSNACNWTGGYTQGATSITLNDCGSKPPVNQFIVLDQASDTGDNGGVFVCNLASCNNEGATSQDGRMISGNNHAQQQFVYVTGVSGSGSGPYTVTFAPPGLYMNNWSENGAFTGTQIGAWWPGQITGIGVENITLDHSSASSSSNSGLLFYDCYNCWIANARSIVSPGGTFAGRNHIWIYQSLNDTVRDSYIFGTHGSEEAYGIETLQESQCLFENNIFHYTTEPLMNGSGSGNVESYNYVVLPVFSFTQMNWQSTIYAVHNASDQMNLYEGNVSPSIIVDDDWGTGPVSMTAFRNYLNGHTLGTQRGGYTSSVAYNPWDIVSYSGQYYAATRYQDAGTTPPTNPSYWFQLVSSTGTSENTNAINLMWGARGVNVIGNVLGDPSYDTQYLVSPTIGSTGSSDETIYSMGFRGVQGTGATDTIVQSSAMLWGNYDTVTNATRWNTIEASPGAILFLQAQTVPSSHALPSSFYLSAQPSWWGTAPFPAIGPDVSAGSGPGGHAAYIPAQSCYSNGSFTKGILNFDANACYGATANPTFSPLAGTYSSAQSVVISSATPSAFICTNTTGSAMSTTGGTSCTNGTHYTGSVTVPSSETLYAIAGATGLADSSQVSASYNIPTSNASLPFLPKVWNDLNEETCQIPSDPSYPCYNGPNGPSPGLLLHAPQYVLTLSPTGGVFSLVQGSPMTLSGGKPPAIAVCSITALGYTSFTFANSYMDSGNGRQQARIDVEKYRACSGGVIGGIIVLPVSASSETGTCGSYNGAKIYCAGAPGSVAPASGFYLPLTSTIQATSPIIERSLQDAVLQGKSQPVCNGGIQFNLPTSTAPGVLNDDCIGDHIAYQLGSIVYCANGIAATNNDPSTCTYTGSFVFGAKTVNTAQFNYAQYMFHASCSGLPFCETERVCSATIISNYLSGASPLCPVSANLTYQTAADHWEIEDEGISIPPQTQNNAVLFDVGSAVQAVFPTQFANDIRCRRCWAHGDWSTLAAGTNQIAAGFGMSACNTCSVVDSSTSMMLRPGAEGHQGNSDGDYQRWENDFFSGQSSGVFAGGFSNTPATPTFTPNMDSTFARVNFYFPQSWLGINCSYNSLAGNSGGNACGNIPDNNIYYGGAGDNFPSTVGLVDPCIGPLLTPPVSVPSWATCVTIDSTRVVVIYTGTGPTFHDDASFWQRTTSILFNPTYTNSYGVGTSGRCQTSLSDTTAKQCSFATWVPSCVANGGEFSSGTGCYPGSPPTSITLTYPVTGCYNLVGGVATFQTTCDGTTPQTMIVNGTSTVRKNIWEFKNAQRLLAYGIIGGNSSNSGGQNAPNFVISPRQTSGTGIEGNSYFTQDTDVLCISCYFYNSGTGFDIGGRSEDNSGDGAGASMPTQRVGLWNFMEVNVSRQNPGANTNAYGSYISTGSQAWLTGTTGGVSCTGTQCTFTAGAGINVDVAQTLNAPLESDTGITGSSSAKTVTITIPNTFVLGETISFVLTGTCLDGIPYKVTVTGNPFTAVAGTGASNCTATITTGTVQGPVGYQVFNFQKGDPVYVYGCTGGSASAINMPSNTAYSSKLNVAVQTGSTYTGYATAASTPWDPVNGWNTSMTTVTYTWATSGPVTDTFGTCTIQNGPGNPQYVTINHATFDTDSNNPLGGGANLAKSSVIQFNSAIVNSILLTNTNPAYSGYNCNVVGNCGFWDSVILPAPQGGTNTEIEQNDVTTATISRLVWPGLASGTCTTTPTAPWNVNGSCTYTPYNNNPLFPAGLSMFFPPTQCNVGFVGTPPWQFGCTGNIVPLSPNDYHQLALYPGSTYSGTCIGIPCGPAADGSDEGAIITGTGFNGSSIDDAQTRLLFACTMAGASYASQCWPSAGTNPGPFPYSNNVVPPTITDIVIQGKPVFKGKPVIK